MLQDRTIPVHLRMAEVLALGNDVQNRIRGEKIFEIETVLERYRGAKAQKRLQQKILSASEPGEADALLCVPDRFEVLDPAWKKDLQIWKRCAETKHSDVIPEHEIEQMVVYYLYTYFCGAVYDADAQAKVKMAIVSTLIWEELVRAAGAQKGEALSFDERVTLACRYSRELEHSDPNLNCMEEQMNQFPAAGFHELMGMLTARAKVDRNR